MEAPIVAFDLKRMFFGDAPPMFLLEIIFRTCVVYAYSLVIIRWIGGRGVSQMSVVEFLLVVALGSAVGDAMFYPEVPLVHALLVITAVGVINKAIDIGMAQSPLVRRLFSGSSLQILKDGVLDASAMQKARLNNDEVFERLREQGFSNLGQVEQGFLETSGKFSFFENSPERSGLQIVPPWNIAPPTLVQPDQADVLCTNCGAKGERDLVCASCGASAWTPRTSQK